MKVKANCKINIGLDILRKREDGFHELQSVMFPVRGLYDEIEIEPASEGITTFRQSGIVIDCDAEHNLCLKAARLIQGRCGAGAVSISLDKRVPFGAGLGGGSSDATAVLVAMNHIFGLNLSEQALIALASELGSDTAFFVRNTPQLCSGRGEIMSPIELPLAGKWLLVAKPDEGVSTREAYGGVRPAIPAIPLAEAVRRPVEEWAGVVKNDFEPHIFAAHPRIAALKEQMSECGAIYTAMSGSGSAVFGVFEDEPNIEFEQPIFTHKERL
ncbi:MAG: 4-(cytidine 5'-diphospho)-2-C-methyl-D-erythritol kinase [Alistipes sp.]|nr:4-(cytidine 5'-diphospho)-2-C-methyl-D-erythritol kinase [Alistipes sp.]